MIDLELGSYIRCEPGQKRTRVGKVDYDADEVLENPDLLKEGVSDELKSWARGVLVNIQKHRGGAALKAGDAISPKEIVTNSTIQT